MVNRIVSLLLKLAHKFEEFKKLVMSSDFLKVEKKYSLTLFTNVY